MNVTMKLQARPIAYEVSFLADAMAATVRKLREACEARGERTEETVDGFRMHSDWVEEVRRGESLDDGFGGITLRVRGTSEHEAIRRAARWLTKRGVEVPAGDEG